MMPRPIDPSRDLLLRWLALLAYEARAALRASVRRHRSNLERGIRRALNGQFIDLPTAAWWCGRMRWMP